MRLPRSLSLFVSAAALVSAQISGNVAKLDYGTFTGLVSDDSSITYFRGIRYAEPPTGDLRFRAPISPPQTDLGSVNATEFAPTCLQSASNSADGASEDCLFLNVNVPYNTTAEDALPVLVWIHGGGFQGGSPSSDPPDYLIHSSAKPLIFVSLQYRLGLFGFLAGQAVNEDGDFNAGLLDQRAAMRWVKEYIGEFGGNSSDITIFGESAGGASIYYQLIANNGDNEDLYVRAIADSPSLGPLPDCTSVYQETVLAEVAAEVGCDGSDILTCLRTADVATIVAASPRVLARYPATSYIFGPCLDGTFVASRIVDAFQTGNVAQVPLLVGSNTDEGLGWSSQLAAPWANTSMANATEATVYGFLKGQYPGLTRASFARALVRYPLAAYEGASEESSALVLQGQAMYGEARYICPAVMAGVYGREVWQYRYDNPASGSGHGSELAAIYRAEPDIPLWAIMRDFWTSFATEGRPQAKGAPVWMSNRYSRNTRMLLNPDRVVQENISGDLQRRCAFWRSLKDEMEV